MTARDDLDRTLTAWMTENAPMGEPEPLLGQVLARTARTRRRPAWLIPERWIPMSTITTRRASMSRVPLRTVGVIALLILALAVAAAVFIGARQPSLPAPFGLAANGSIVYGEGGDIYIRDTLSGESRVLIGGPTVDVGATFSNDGTLLSFLRISDDTGKELADFWIANADGSDPHRVAGPFDSPDWYDWSPDRDVIAVQSKVDGKRVLTMVPIDGSNPKPLDIGVEPIEPTWRAPDGHQLVFRGIDAKGSPGVYLVDRDGSNLKPLALDTGLAPGTPVSNDFFGDMTVSPDGNHIAFHSPTSDPTGPQGIGLQVHVATIDAAGNVLEDLAMPHLAGDADYDPAFLPGSDRLIFWRNRTGQPPSLQIAPLDGDVAATVDLHCCVAADGSSTGVGLFLSPDGTKLLVEPGAGSSIQVIDLDTLEPSRAGFATDDFLTWQRQADSR